MVPINSCYTEDMSISICIPNRFFAKGNLSYYVMSKDLAFIYRAAITVFV